MINVGNRLSRRCGIALVFAGTLTILINGIVAPFMLARHLPPEVVPTTNIYLLRQSLSGLAALLLIFGCLGIHLVQREASGIFGAVAFVTAFIGGCLLFAVEFADVFILPAVAVASPETYVAIDKNPFMSIGFGSAAALFTIGWLLLAISVWRIRLLPRWAAITTFAGLFLIPILQAPFGFPGGIAGNVVFGLGLMGLGFAVATLASRVTP
jgi:hypothetical protein